MTVQNKKGQVKEMDFFQSTDTQYTYLIEAEVENLVLIDFVSRNGLLLPKGLALLLKTYGKTTCKALSSDSIHFVTVSALAHFIKATICHFLLHLQPLKLGIHPEIDCLSI